MSRITCAICVLAVVVMSGLCAVLSPATAAGSPEPVEIRAPEASRGDFTGLLFRPSGAGPFPAVLALHGCGGLLTKSGRLQAREADWAERFTQAGYVVLFPDSFTARGMREICTQRERTIDPRDRADDAKAAVAWLQTQSFVDPTRIALLGWSHGAMTVLATLRPDFLGAAPPFKVAVALYPGCRATLRQADWHPSVPLTLLIGAEDDWTEPGPCKDLAAREGFRFVAYPGAYHGFDAPHSPVRIRKHLGAVRRGEAHVGTNPAAREAAIAEIMETLSRSLAASR